MHDFDAPIAVTAASGKTGRRVADLLKHAGVPTRRLSRGGPDRFDWGDTSTWVDALTGARAAYLAYVPDLAVPGASDRVRALSSLAVDQGVERLVLLSGRGEPEAQMSEQIVRDFGAQWTVLRASWFMQNFSESYFVEGVRAGVLALPVNAVREPFVDADDIAELAVAALTQDGHAGRLYEVTGPDLLTFGDAVAQVAQATGRDIRFQTVTMPTWLAGLEQQGVPPDVVALLGYLFNEVLDGRNEYLADGVQDGLGRPPRSFAGYVDHAAATGVWDAR